jgi:hypothetical protein
MTAKRVTRSIENVEPVYGFRSAKGSFPKQAQANLVAICASAGLDVPVAEYRFHPKRRWRFDYAWPDRLLALEVEGGLWVNGRHSRGSGAVADLEKYSEAAILGWKILYATPAQVRNLVALDRIERALIGL